VDCTTHQVLGPRTDLVEALRRPLLRAAPGPIEAVVWEPDAGRFRARGTQARPDQSFFVFWPARLGTKPRLAGEGVHGLHLIAAPGGHRFVAGRAHGGAWALEIETR